MSAQRNAPCIRLLIAEDHFLPRFAVESLIAMEPDLMIVGQVETGEDAIVAYQRWLPDVVMMDIRMPKLDGISAASAIIRQSPTAKILMLSQYDTEEDVGRALEAGASGYLRKDVTAAELLAAIRAVAAGERVLDSRASEASRLRGADKRLTAREQEVLSLVATGANNPEIGKLLGISEGTVRIHMSHLMSKLGVSRRTEAVTEAMKRGLLRPRSGE